jgi:hypothetical protein
MFRRFPSIAWLILAVLILVGVFLAWNEYGPTRASSGRAGATAEPQVDVRFSEQPASQSYEGRIKDVRPVWSVLILSVGKGKQARRLRLDISEARIVGPSGAEWKGEDLRVGDPVRVEMTEDGKLVRQVSVLPDKARDLNNPIR